jgi:hypothetical protein
MAASGANPATYRLSKGLAKSIAQKAALDSRSDRAHPLKIRRRLSAAMNNPRAKFDRMAWASIKRRKASKGAKPGVARASNYPEILEWMKKGSVMWGSKSKSFDDAFHDFLDEFYYFKRASFFRQEPPKEFTQRQRAFLAATAEYLCRRFKLRCPAWTKKPEYFLDEEWDVLEFGNRRKSAPEFRRHGIIFAARGLIRL